jgi:hypothetical protein
MMQYAAEISHVERIVRPWKLIGTPSKEFDSPPPLFFFCDLDCIIRWVDGSDTLRVAPVKQFNRKCAVAAADIDQTFIADANALESSPRHSLIREAAAQGRIGRVKIAAVTAYIRAKRFDRILIRHPDLGWFDHCDGYVGFLATKSKLPSGNVSGKLPKTDAFNTRKKILWFEKVVTNARLV